jgi:two-component system, OmpR family, copper resistance phosphate regulon response regulator CusR
VRIAVIEDDERVSRFVIRGLRAKGYAVASAHDGDIAAAVVEQTRPDLVILDLLLPGRSGQDVLLDLAEHHPELPVIVLSSRRDIETRLETLSSGACDYMTKPFSLEELLMRVRLRLRERPRSDAVPGDLRYGSLVLDTKSRRADVGEGAISLTDREFHLLETLMRSAGEVVSREELLSSVWGYGHDTGTNVVDVAILRLRSKIGYERITSIRSAGYLLEER